MYLRFALIGTYHESSHSFFLYSLFLLLLLSVSYGVITHHCSVKFHHLGLYRPMVFTEISCMLQDGVEVLLMLLPAFSFLFHLLLFFKFLSYPKTQVECVVRQINRKNYVHSQLQSTPFVTNTLGTVS